MTNMTDIEDAFLNLNTTVDFNGTTILNNAIDYNNVQSDGWTGLIIYAMFGIMILLFLFKFREEFKLNSEISLTSFFSLVMCDLGLILYQYRIIWEIQVVVFIITLFIVVIIFNLLKKERESFSI